MSDGEPLHQLLRASAQRRGDHPLLVTRDGQLSYAEADRASSALAAALRRRGVEPGDRVGLGLPNIGEYPISYYGILKAGAAVVPFPPDTRGHALSQMLRHCAAKAVILDRRGCALLGELPALELVLCHGPPPADPPAGPRLLSLAETLAGPEQLHDGGARGDQLASVMYTSGTTAEPKGVMLSHRNLLSNTRSIVEYLALGADERAGLVLPFFYSYGTSILHTHVLVGATIVVLGSVAFPAAVLRGIEQQRCTGLPGVPSTFARLVHSDTLDQVDLRSLRYLTQAGGPMTPALTRKLRRAIPDARLFVMYGQTEAAPRLSYLDPDELDRKLGTVGKAIPGVTLAVVDESGAAVEPGVVGELVARGDNVMLGYWQDPAATARALRPEGLRTGDLATVDDEGFITLVGRKGDMIKAGAHRVGPKEIEAVVEQLPEVAQCAVVGIPDEILGEAIAAFVVRVAGSALSEQQLLRWCFEHLPRFKMPTHVVFIEALPRTATGKLRRSELRRWRPA